MSKLAKARIPVTTGFLLVLLRVAIGWHFFYEGYWKIESAQPGHTPFTAENYLRASQGPLEHCFVDLIDDADGLQRLTDEDVKQRIDARFDLYVSNYKLDDQQRQTLENIRERCHKEAEQIRYNEDFQIRLTDYKTFLQEYNASACDREGDFTQERRTADHGRLGTYRRQLLAEIQQPLRKFESTAYNLLTVDQRKKGPLPPIKSQTYLLDFGMTWGLTLIGAALMLGVFTRLACLGAAALLATFYLSMPPWPGLAPNPMAEGHYLFVNKNLIEFIAVLMLATTRSGRWFGFDGFIGYFLGKLFGRRPTPPASVEYREEEISSRVNQHTLDRLSPPSITNP